MSDATLSNNRAISVHVSIPKWGAWWADVELDVEATLSGVVPLRVADVTFTGCIVSGGPVQGRSRYRLVGGKGGWGKTIAKRGYANDAGVKVSTVVTDAAQAAGETLDTATIPSTRVGPHFARPEGPACRVLELVAPSAWYVGEDGVTRFGARDAKAFTGKAAREPVDRAAGTVTIAPETLVGLTPGAIVDGLTAVDVAHVLERGKLRSTIWGRQAGQTSRRLEAFRAILDQLDPGRRFSGVWEYRVVTLEGERANLQPVRVSTGMPDLQRVPIAAGVAGAKSTLTPGARVLVAFVDQSPGRPTVIGHEDADGSGFKPLVSEIDATTAIKLGLGIKPAIAAGDLAGIFPCVPTQTKVLI